MILSVPNPRSSSPSLASGMSYQANDPKSSARRRKGLATPASRPCGGLRRTPAYAQERRPCYRLGRTRRPRALVPGEEACGSRRSAKGARGDQRRHTCPCPAFDCHADGFPRRDPSRMQLPALLLPWFPSSPLRRLSPAGLPTTLRGAAEGSTPPQLPPTRLGATVCDPCSTSVPIPSRSPRAM